MSSVEWAGKGWRVTILGDDAHIFRLNVEVKYQGKDAARLVLRRRVFRTFLVDDGQRVAHLKGIRKSDAASLEVQLRRLAFLRALEDATEWGTAVVDLLAEHRTVQRWISTEDSSVLTTSRPYRGLLDRIDAARCNELFEQPQLDAARFLEVDVQSMIDQANEEIMAAELVSRRQFFDTIEKSPLTTEQARAVICFDNRVQVLAAAGSGKTSVMVARAAYAVERGFVSPDRILILAFNKAAATELEERVKERFESAGIDSHGIRASTFHSFGLSVIGRATGRKPRLAEWLEQGEDIEKIVTIVDILRDSSPTFRIGWDMYRLLFANAPIDLENGTPDAYDKETRLTGYKTFSGVMVKSHGERMVADFLFLNGVEFEYEKPYVQSTADEYHSQYRPDFYYPSVDVWHEHWALDQGGKAPKEFEGYDEAIIWKRHLHEQYGTKLVESTWADVVFGDGLKKLQLDLEKVGLEFDWNPDREIRDPFIKPMKHEDLARLMRTFMSHVKSNSWSPDDLERRLSSEQPRLKGYRTRLFLGLYWQIHAEWDRQLRVDDSVDFEDMLVRAAGYLDEGQAEFPYELIMVDEFQDASRARARMVQGLVKGKGRYLLTVGDDWQSINRFAGSDMSVMTGFRNLYGQGPQLALTTTFRCAQTICDVARDFVSKNPSQFNKPMRSALEDTAGSVTVILDDDNAEALIRQLSRLAGIVADGSTPSHNHGRISVDVLGRYGFFRDVLPEPEMVGDEIDLTFRTVHSSKGLEADYVVIPGMSADTYGFPSNIADDPILALAMPAPESFAHAEERRLLYVALTRARRGVILIAPPDRMSPFVVQLVDDPKVEVISKSGKVVEICKKCHQGTMVARTGPYGQFLGCSRFPACTEKLKIVTAAPTSDGGDMPIANSDVINGTGQP